MLSYSEDFYSSKIGFVLFLNVVFLAYSACNEQFVSGRIESRFDTTHTAVKRV